MGSFRIKISRISHGPEPQYVTTLINANISAMAILKSTHRPATLHPADERRWVAGGGALEVHGGAVLAVDDVRVLHYLHLG